MSDAEDYSTVIDLRPRLGEVGDQGRRGTCVAFALTTVHYCAIGEVNSSTLSEEFLYWASKLRDGIANDGTTYAAAVDGLAAEGQCVAQLWRYEDTRSHRHPDYRPTAEAAGDAAGRKARGHRNKATVDNIRSSLADGTALAIAVPIWDHFEITDGMTVESVPANATELRLEHAVVVAGHDNERAAILIRNSWGSDWGDNGYAWFDDSLLEVSAPVGAWTVTPEIAPKLGNTLDGH